MRYLPLDASEREAMLTRIGVPDIEALFADIPADKRIEGASRPAARHERNGGRARDVGDRRSQRRRRLGSVFPRLRRLSATTFRRPSIISSSASEFLTSYTPYQPEIAQGHAASPVRVPDPGGGADRHGGRQRLDVRRLDRVRRSDADGPPPDAAQQGGDLRRPASAICRRLRDAGAYGGRQRSSAAARISRHAKISPRRSTARRAASSCSRPISSAIRATLRQSPRRRTRMARS